MAQADTQANPATAQVALPLGVAMIRGRIKAVRRFNGQAGGYLHVIALPAPNEYAMPASVEVHADAPLGEVETMWHGKVRVAGIPKSYDSEREDPKTGEVRKVKVATAFNQLFAV